MGHFYFTRHGQTIWNVENKICGATDIALTDLGHKQALELGQYIKDNHIHIDQISLFTFKSCKGYCLTYI